MYVCMYVCVRTQDESEEDMQVVKYLKGMHDDDAGVYERARLWVVAGVCVRARECVCVNTYTYEEKNAWMPLIA